MARHLLPVSNYRAIASAIGEELRAHYRPSKELLSELQKAIKTVSLFQRRRSRQEAAAVARDVAY
jgi:hypothetical protein